MRCSRGSGICASCAWRRAPASVDKSTGRCSESTRRRLSSARSWCADAPRRSAHSLTSAPQTLLDLSQCGLGDDAIAALFASLRRCSTLRDVSLSENAFGDAGGGALLDFLSAGNGDRLTRLAMGGVALPPTRLGALLTALGERSAALRALALGGVGERHADVVGAFLRQSASVEALALDIVCGSRSPTSPSRRGCAAP